MYSQYIILEVYISYRICKKVPVDSSKTVPAARRALTTPLWVEDWPVTHALGRASPEGCHINTDPQKTLNN